MLPIIKIKLRGHFWYDYLGLHFYFYFTDLVAIGVFAYLVLFFAKHTQKIYFFQNMHKAPKKDPNIIIKI